MKASKIVLLLVLCLCLCGYTRLQIMSDEYILRELNRREPSEAILKASYPEVFKATISVFQDLNINIIRKNYEAKFIFGNCFEEDRMRYCLDPTGIYGAFFEDNGNNGTKISIKCQGPWFSSDFILNKIKEEIELQKKMERY